MQVTLQRTNHIFCLILLAHLHDHQIQLAPVLSNKQFELGFELIRNTAKFSWGQLALRFDIWLKQLLRTVSNLFIKAQ